MACQSRLMQGREGVTDAEACRALMLELARAVPADMEAETFLAYAWRAIDWMARLTRAERLFLAWMLETPNVAEAARRMGVTRQRAYQIRRRLIGKEPGLAAVLDGRTSLNAPCADSPTRRTGKTATTPRTGS